MRDWRGQKVVIIGAARQGIALARYLVKQGARVLMNDQLPYEALGKARQSLAEFDIEWVCGGHPLEVLEGADWVCPSGGVPLSLPLIVEAKKRAIPLSNDSQIFLESAPCQVIGITGSAGKSTTTSLVARIADRAFEGSARKVWVGGNIGVPLIALLDEMAPQDLAIVELSSFQLEVMRRSPHIAAILNISPNHLDRHETMEAYIAAKARILDFQDVDHIAVLNHDDPATWGLKQRVKGKIISFGLTKPPLGQSGAFLLGEHISIQVEGAPVSVLPRTAIALRGEHNVLNVLAACAIAYAAGMPSEAMLEGVSRFKGIPHRLEFVRTWGGADWYNDSIATAPERTIAALRSFKEPLILLAGGRDKKLPWGDFAALVCKQVDHLITFGESAERIAQVVEEYRRERVVTTERPLSMRVCRTLREAVQQAARLVSPGSVVLLSPGGTSFDEFHDFEERGEMFKKWVMELP